MGARKFISITGPGAERIATHFAIARPEFELGAHESATEALGAIEAESERSYCAAVVATDASVATDVFGAYRSRWPDAACFLYTADPPAEFDPETPFYEFVDDETSRRSLVDRVAHAVYNRTHTAYPVRADERTRLRAVDSLDVGALVGHAALQRVLDRLLDETDASMGGVGIVTDHTERFVVLNGPVDEWTLDRQETVCTHTILEDGAYVVEDLAENTVFAAREPARMGLRAYAGCAVRAGNGPPVGSVCVLDTEPRAFSDEHRRSVERAAAAVTEVLREERCRSDGSGQAAGSKHDRALEGERD
jgi:hypothetical protein